ncbi:MAG: hypothetical protein M1827_007062 [Pycnora praestabilis]|nr:MAG: hypothetical protein M1827_007062 [Pycnora praestabilis]
MKRKAEELTREGTKDQPPKNRVGNVMTAQTKFRDGLFDKDVLEDYTKQYAKSQPYKHGVIQKLVSPTLLRSVRKEIQDNLSFSPKETDIYKIHQSGDLANLDGLDDSSLRLLPSLLTLRDALYSLAFRTYLSMVTDSGPLSGNKTDMAINVYTPGCHLLCHDDVIGSRRVSYILYLTDPDKAWKTEWGGALRLYPTHTFMGEDGLQTKTPSPDFTASIPPAFNQLSFFAVQPGESFHDVEEVHADDQKVQGENKGERVRMAISGWYHIPQEGEEGYVEGLEEQLAEKSSLVQLQGKADRFDFPEPKPQAIMQDIDEGQEIDGGKELSEKDLEFLVGFLAPTYLTPETVEELSEMFSEESSLRMENFLSNRFSTRLRTYIEGQEKQSLPSSTTEIEKSTNWKVARPPHKHRFLYQQRSDGRIEGISPFEEIIEILLPSRAFTKWLALVTGLKLESCNVLARRFRRGLDYSLATGYDEGSARVELTLGVTPTDGWGDEEQGEGDTANDKEDSDKNEENAGVGGYEVYMAGDEEEYDNVEEGVTNSDQKKSKADPAIYKSSGGGEDDGVLFSMPAGWNRMSIVLRDTGVLKFVKYISRSARGDRWDITGEYGVIDDSDVEDEHTQDVSPKNDDE